LLEQCERGYSDNIYEYYNDIRIREWIEVILSAPELQKISRNRRRYLVETIIKISVSKSIF
jgi:hypothetical protein